MAGITKSDTYYSDWEILQTMAGIRKCGRCYKVWQVLKIVRENIKKLWLAVITKWHVIQDGKVKRLKLIGGENHTKFCQAYFG